MELCSRAPKSGSPVSQFLQILTKTMYYFQYLPHEVFKQSGVGYCVELMEPTLGFVDTSKWGGRRSL